VACLLNGLCLHGKVNHAIRDQFHFHLSTSVDNVNFLFAVSDIFKWICANCTFISPVLCYGVYIMICFVVFGRLVALYTLGLICLRMFFGSEGFSVHYIFHRIACFGILFVFIPYLF
jgi:hypothetical protein